jgi:two-component system, OmpR family, response regulator QseB
MKAAAARYNSCSTRLQTSENKPVRILLVEDDPLLASGLVTALKNAHHLPEHVADGEAAVRALQKGHGFDMVILDLGLPKLDGTQVLARVRQQGQTIPILILSARDATRDRIQGLDLGADDYLTKPFELEELMAHLRVLERRLGGNSSNQIKVGDLSLDLAHHTVQWKGRAVELQRREFMLLRQLAERPDHVFSRTRIEEALYGWNDGVESNAIDVYVHSLRKKISPDIIKTIRGVGYRIGHTGTAA